MFCLKKDFIIWLRSFCFPVSYKWQPAVPSVARTNYPQHSVEVSGQFNAPAALPQWKDSVVSTG
jgi:hypothetical protein